MAVKKIKPTTPGRRFSSVVSHAELSKKRPEKKLTRTRKQKAGRNAQGKVTVRHKGGGHKRFYRIIDNQRNRYDEAATVLAIEYDPNRTAWIALIQYADGEKSYIVAPTGLKEGATVVSSQKKVEIETGNRMPLQYIPVGVMVHDVQLSPTSQATTVRAAGTSALIQSVESEYAQVKLPSGEIRLFDKNCMATVGQVSNSEHGSTRMGKAGKKRWKGIRPTVTGKSMNPVDHPHGGGEGHAPIGLKHPKTKWGKPAIGVRTRRAHKESDRLIIKRRKSKK